jgi:uncharacterized protein (UPF0216 family)
MTDEQVLRRWFSVEMGKLLETFVPVPRPLHDLLREERPTALTRSGDVHPFERSALTSLSNELPPLTRAQIRLPLTLHIDNETPGDVYSSDPSTNDVLMVLGVTTSTPRDGRLWVSAPLARDFARRYPTLVQFVMH